MKEPLFETALLPCGLRVVRTPSPTDVVFCGYAVAAGSRNELPGEEGLAHFVEHTLFKGTHRRRAWHILNRMENVGGDLNAFTGKEETVIYATFLRKDFSRALELLTDIVFHSTFPEHEVERERSVVLDEIDSCADVPTDLIFDEFEDILFAGHPLGHPVLGTRRSVRKFTAADVRRFHQRHYTPQCAILFVSGPVSLQRIVALSTRLTTDLCAEDNLTVPERLGGLDGRETPSGQKRLGELGSLEGLERLDSLEPLDNLAPPENEQIAPPSSIAQHADNLEPIIRHRHTHQALCLTGCTALPMGDEHHPALLLLSNLLGGPGMNSRLNVVLRERLGLVYDVETNLTAFTDTGVFSVCFGCDPDDLDRCLELTRTELLRLVDTPLTSRQLAAARRQLLGQLGVSAVSLENSALATAKAFLHGHDPIDADTFAARLEAFTPADLQHIAADFFNPDAFIRLIYK